MRPGGEQLGCSARLYSLCPSLISSSACSQNSSSLPTGRPSCSHSSWARTLILSLDRLAATRFRKLCFNSSIHAAGADRLSDHLSWKRFGSLVRSCVPTREGLRSDPLPISVSVKTALAGHCSISDRFSADRASMHGWLPYAASVLVTSS